MARWGLTRTRDGPDRGREVYRWQLHVSTTVFLNDIHPRISATKTPPFV